jgi:hypothetical protein
MARGWPIKADLKTTYNDRLLNGVATSLQGGSRFQPLIVVPRSPGPRLALGLLSVFARRSTSCLVAR